MTRSNTWILIRGARMTIVDWRIVADFIARKSPVFLGASVFYLIICLPIYTAPGFTGTGLIMLVLASFSAMLGAEISFIAPAGNSGRCLVQLPVAKYLFARTHWFVGVAVPALWVCGLTLLTSPLAATGSHFTWLSVILTCSAALALVAFYYCLTALGVNLRRLAWRKVARTAGPLATTIVAIGLLGGVYLAVQWVDSGRWRPVVWVLSVAFVASLTGFARMHAVITAERSIASPRRTGLNSNSGGRWMFLRRLSGFPSIAATAVGMPVLFAACFTAVLLIAKGLVYLMEHETLSGRLTLPTNASGYLLLVFFVLYAFIFTAQKFSVPRILLTLPLSPLQISVRITLVVVVLALVQFALTAIGFFAAGLSAEVPFLFALLGSIGLGSLSIPGFLAGLHRLAARLIASLGTIAGLFVWFIAAPGIAALQEIALIVFVARLLLSIFLSKQVIVRNLWIGNKSLPVHQLHAQGGA